jgi:hypothetical protein
MPRALIAAVAIVLSFATITAADAASHHKRPAKVARWHGYGFLPGYRSPERIEWENWRARRRDPFANYWYGGPGYYRGRWNGGGFGPCWTKTPIGPIWNCG